jgi:GGDEF domain-containing protein
MQPGPPRRRPGRAVPDASLDALRLRVEDLAKGWLLALVEDAPLERVAELPVADLAREGPAVCDSVVRALADDRELERIGHGGVLPRLWSGDPRSAVAAEAVVHAIDALAAVIWSALRDEVTREDPDQLAHLVARLLLVFEHVRAAGLRGLAAEPKEELAGSSWTGRLEAEIERAARAGGPLALLLVELDDADRLLAVETQADAAATFARFRGAVGGVAGANDIVMSESESRAWVISPRPEPDDARALGTRIAAAVAAEPWRGAPLSVSVGAAVLGEDGHDAEALIESAERAALAAAAEGVAVLGDDR